MFNEEEKSRIITESAKGALVRCGVNVPLEDAIIIAKCAATDAVEFCEMAADLRVNALMKFAMDLAASGVPDLSNPELPDQDILSWAKGVREEATRLTATTSRTGEVCSEDIYSLEDGEPL